MIKYASMDREPAFQRGLHPWIIAAEGWSVDDWREKLVGAPDFLIEAASKISRKTKEGRDKLLGKAASLPADNVADYVRYEIMADVSTLSGDALDKLLTAAQMNKEAGVPLRGEGGINWEEVYYLA